MNPCALRFSIKDGPRHLKISTAWQGSHGLRRNKSLEVRALQGIGAAYLLGIRSGDFYERN
jgi:hypothetical protein